MKRKIFSVFMAILMLFSVVVIPGMEESNITVSALKEVKEGEWIAAWGTGLTDISVKDYTNIYIDIPAKTTGRMIISPTADGEKIRVKLSNVYGTDPLTIHMGSVAKVVDSYNIDRDTDIAISVNGRIEDFVIPAGEEVYTDPINMPVKAGEKIAVSLYLKEEQKVSSIGLTGGETYIALDNVATTHNKGYIPFSLSSSSIKKVAAFGAFFLNDFLSVVDKIPDISVVPIISAVDVYNTEEDPYSIVVIGDSTVANDVPLYLSRLIHAENCTSVGVVCKGIIGNSLLSDGQGMMGNIYGPSVLSRMDRDVFEQSGVRYVVLKIGANDIIHPESASIAAYGEYEQPSVEEMIEGFEEFIDYCHLMNVKVIGCSITQWKGTTRNYFGDDDYEFKAEDWQIALDINEWLSKTKKLDGFVDLAKITGATNDSAKFKSTWTNDFIHPNALAQQAWAKEFPLELFDIDTVPKNISLNKTKLSLSVGGTATLKETIVPSSAGKREVTWKSSNTKVATVSSSGKVTAVGNGTATITCTTVNGKKATCKVTVDTKTTGVSLNSTSVTLYDTQTYQLKATVKPTTASDKSVTWKSSNTAVAKVSASGKITAVKSGTATITCTTKDTGKTATCKVTVKKRTAVTSVSLNKTKATVYSGKTLQLAATVSPSKATIKDVTWKSSNTKVATVSASGKVTAKKNGTAKITAVTADGKYTATCTVTVKTKATGVSLNKTTATVYVGKKLTLVESVKPASASNTAVTWKSSNKNVAKVDSNGTITGVSTGTATITCTTKDGSFKATCNVTVKKYVKTKSVSLNAASKSMSYGGTYQLKATVSPSNATKQTVTWKSSNTKVAKVSASGKVTAVGAGTATITCTTADGVKATCKITVKGVKVQSVKLSSSSATLTVGATKTLKATVSPSNASNKSVTWASSNTKVAKVSASGKVTAVSAGTATITCKTKDGSYTAKCKITVKNPTSSGNQKVVGVKLNTSVLSLKVGAKYQLIATVLPTNAANKNVTWSTSDPSIATVSSTGMITAKKAGRVTITVKTKDQNRIASCTVTIKN